MGVLSSILQSYDDIEEELKFFIFDNSSIVFAEFTSDLLQDGTMKWAKLKPIEVYLQAHVLSDYVRLTSWCSLILKNVNSRNVGKFEQSIGNVLSYIEQDTILMFTTLKDIFADIKSELDLQRHIIAQPYRDTLLNKQIG
ncbi:hypothetical protein [Paenibacillus sp. S150]|uniref:hypothetical protein n=1 Tax=Paenibacillus sp. S150 TaxID=2749826 RepID=UPI001C5665BB|nr:hypothetical protein [Paenibacillus sp. S150]MBW4080722.1 hypothetical protein [Paenibacillus sp. S150]